VYVRALDSLDAQPLADARGLSLDPLVFSTDGEWIAMLNHNELQKVSIHVYSPTGHILYRQGSTIFAALFDVDDKTVGVNTVAMLEGVRRAFPDGREQRRLPGRDRADLVSGAGAARPNRRLAAEPQRRPGAGRECCAEFGEDLVEHEPASPARLPPL